MNWRPEGWKHCYQKQDLYITRETPLSLRNGLMESAETVYEYGASAMFVALMEELRSAPGMDTFHYRKLCKELGYEAEQ